MNIRNLSFFLSLFVFTGCGNCADTDVQGEDMAGASDMAQDSNSRADAARDQAGSTDMVGSADQDQFVDVAADMIDQDLSQAICGDGLQEGAEACDDGNTDPDDYCAPDCTQVTGSCSDGTTQNNESCDDGNTNADDYCSADCSQVTGSCGDSTLQANETCDDGGGSNCDGHDGGDGSCVATGACVTGYSLTNGVCVSTNTTGLPTACSLGPGQALFKFGYSNSSTSAQIDVWDAACAYSFAPNSACNVRQVYPGFGDVDVTSEGYPILTSSEYIRVRYSVTGIQFSKATLYVQARSYSTGSSTQINAWSPIYGGFAYGPVDNDFVYDYYATDWSMHLSPSDSPSLTAIQIYAYQGSNKLAVKSVELCLE